VQEDVRSFDRICLFQSIHEARVCWLTAFVFGLLISACLPIERSVDARMGPVMEVWLAQTNWTTDGCVLHWTSINTSGLRTIQPLLELEIVDDIGRRFGHGLQMMKLSPGDEQTIDLELDIETCRHLDSINIPKACNVAPASFCNPDTCQFADHCELTATNGLPYSNAEINLAALNDLPSLVSLYVFPMGKVGGCLFQLQRDVQLHTPSDNREICIRRFYGSQEQQPASSKLRTSARSRSW